MKKNVNVFIAVLLVAVLCGGVIWLQTADEEKLGWNIHDSYGDTPSYSGGAAYTNATFAGPSAAEGGVMPLSSSSALRARSSYSYAGAYAISYGVSSAPLTSNLSPLTYGGAGGGQGLYTTSSKTFNSYGGGGNGGAATGGSVRGGVSTSQPVVGGSIAYAPSPISYTTSRRQAMPSTGDNPAMIAAENPMVAMANAANAANAGMNTSFYGGMYTTADYSSADYGQYSGMFGGGSRMGVRGRQNGGPNNLNDTWLNWLALNGSNYGTFDSATNTWYLDYDALRSAWEAFCATWNEGMGTKPTWEQWLAWFEGSQNNPYEWSDGSNSSFYTYLPVGNILPLLLFALVYVVILFLKRNKIVQL